MTTTTTTTMNPAVEYLTLGQVAVRLGIEVWKVQKLYDAKRVPTPARGGRLRLVPETDLGAVREAAAKAGYLK